jgi:glycosyltransferase involved in cell wall biosynthesis
MLAHNVSMLDIFKGLVSLKNKTIRPIVFCFSKIDSTSSLSFENELRNMKIEIIYLDDFFELKNDGNNILKKLSLLKEILSHYKIHKFIAVSVCVWLNFIFSMQIAPIQIYLSLKYHSFNHPKIDFYITPGTFGEEFRLINGIKWLTYPPSLSNLFDPKLTVHAKEIKTQLGQNKVIISCIAREEKLRNFNYLKLIASILKKCPEAIFLWAGKTNDLFISNFFNDNNLNSQVIFIGWVDTRLYAQVIDIFLDCFPQPAGHTLYQAMAAGVPFVTSLLSDQNMGIQSSINNMILLKFEEGKIESIFNLDTARPHYLLAKDEDEYIELAIKLIRDESFRVDVGNAGRKFVQEYLSDIKKSAESFQNIISKFI